jgi:hypothetical protein
MGADDEAERHGGKNAAIHQRRGIAQDSLTESENQQNLD